MGQRKQGAMPTNLLTVRDVMNRLKVARSSVYRLVDRGELHPIKMGRSVRFDEQDVEAYIERCKEPGGPGETPAKP